jgi:hypothetical protein
MSSLQHNSEKRGDEYRFGIRPEWLRCENRKVFFADHKTAAFIAIERWIDPEAWVPRAPAAWWWGYSEVSVAPTGAKGGE